MNSGNTTKARIASDSTEARPYHERIQNSAADVSRPELSWPKPSVLAAESPRDRELLEELITVSEGSEVDEARWSLVDQLLPDDPTYLLT